MSDRFYQQQADFFKLAPWELVRAQMYPESNEAKRLNKAATPTRNKKELSDYFVQSTGIDVDLTKLKVPTLTSIVEALDYGVNDNIPIPTGRLKAPYIKCIRDLIGDPTLDLDSGTIAIFNAIIKGIVK